MLNHSPPSSSPLAYPRCSRAQSSPARPARSQSQPASRASLTRHRSPSRQPGKSRVPASAPPTNNQQAVVDFEDSVSSRGFEGFLYAGTSEYPTVSSDGTFTVPFVYSRPPGFHATMWVSITAYDNSAFRKARRAPPSLSLSPSQLQCSEPSSWTAPALGRGTRLARAHSKAEARRMIASVPSSSADRTRRSSIRAGTRPR